MNNSITVTAPPTLRAISYVDPLNTCAKGYLHNLLVYNHEDICLWLFGYLRLSLLCILLRRCLYFPKKLVFSQFFDAYFSECSN